MTPRPTMQKLIAKTRALVPEVSADSFSDDQIQELLDFSREYHARESLNGLPDYAGFMTQFESGYRFWDEGVVLADGNNLILSPQSSDGIAGLWVFAQSQSSVYATGWVYDPYAVAAEMLTIMAGKVGQEVTKFSADGSSYEFGGIKNAYLKHASELMALSPRLGGVKSVGMVRNDCNAI